MITNKDIKLTTDKNLKMLKRAENRNKNSKHPSRNIKWYLLCYS